MIRRYLETNPETKIYLHFNTDLMNVKTTDILIFI